MFEAVSDISFAIGKKFVPIEREWPEPANSPAHTHRVMDEVAEDTESKKCHPGWAKDAPYEKSEGNIGERIVEEGSMGTKSFAADGTTLCKFNPEINVGEQGKTHSQKYPEKRDWLAKNKPNEECPHDSEFKIKKHRWREIRNG